ncbi:MAG: O-antigen ligase family protein [Candidatus Magasanikbacteria bacterium]|nr:O-antigen ligase family protein [Candidatus Magasanikbacteria bacterium]
MQKNLEYFIKGLVYLSFFVPLLVLPSSFIFPFIVPKILLFRSLSILMFGAYLLLCVSNPRQYLPRLSPVLVALGLFILSFSISTFAGVDAYHSFWDNHERMLGLFTILHYFIYFLVITAIFRSWSEWRQLFWVFLIAGSAVMFVGMLQVGNADLLLNQGSDRVASTLGNPIYVGGYGLFLAFVAALLIAKERQLAWRLAAAFFGIFALLGMFYSGTRGSMLGFIAGLFSSLIIYGIFSKTNFKARLASGLVLASLLVLVSFAYNWRHTTFVQNIPAVGRAVNTSLSSVKSSPRWVAWAIAWESFVERPVFGWGPNNFFYAFNKHYNPRSLEFGYGETWFDNAHNIIMNTLSVQGGLGLVTYLGIFAMAVGVLLRQYRRGAVELNIVLFGSAFLVAHLVQNITVFENPTSYLYFMVWLAFVNRFTTASADQSALRAPFVSRPISKSALGATALVLILWIYVFNVQPARANSLALKTLRAISQDPVGSSNQIKAALAFNSPHIDDVRNDIGRIILNAVPDVSQKFGSDKAKELMDLLEPALLENTRLHPGDIRVYMLLGQLYRFRATLDRDPQEVMRAITVYEQALVHSPRRQQLVYSLAELYGMIGNNKKAVELIEQSIVDNPKIAEGYIRLAYLYSTAKQPAEAAKIIATAKERGVVFNSSEAAAATQILGATK